ncbi:YtoQ family protein [Piscirickettsia litoralis]|uniref:YtoQ family protein n=1 Tax=Piscirickettsia litoralis TaxID=1891921 RepID=A0ABX2ZZM8_9GAMM|nr:YtoQ family protein [Piscirickettsia litoralis]ODN41688.1 hypothetical protein BGC07_00190 [Piscirickettsia litoralis]
MKQALAVYLSGEIHSDWRQRIHQQVIEKELNIELLSPVTDHARSDDCGDKILGKESTAFWKDHKAAKINAIRTTTLLQKADIVVVKFGEKYRQWNAAFDAGYAIAMKKPLLVIHPAEFTHALKEVDAQALAVAETEEQIADILEYILLDCNA